MGETVTSQGQSLSQKRDRLGGGIVRLAGAGNRSEADDAPAPGGLIRLEAA